MHFLGSRTSQAYLLSLLFFNMELKVMSGAKGKKEDTQGLEGKT